MTKQILQIYEKMTPQEQQEVESFALFVIARRKLGKQQLLMDEISTNELLQLVENAGSFDWLDAESEDLYSINDGEVPEW